MSERGYGGGVVVLESYVRGWTRSEHTDNWLRMCRLSSAILKGDASLVWGCIICSLFDGCGVLCLDDWNLLMTLW